MFPSFEASAGIDQLNAAFGPGTAQLAVGKAEFLELNGKMHFAFVLKDADLGFDVAVSGVGSAAINNRSVSDPVALPFRALNGQKANPSFWAASQSVTLAVPIPDTSLLLAPPIRCCIFRAERWGSWGWGPT